MPPWIASIVFCIGIAGLFWLDRDRSRRPSPAIWIAIAWLLIGSSRNLSEWLGAAAPLDQVERYEVGNPLDRLALGGLQAAGLAVLVARGRRSLALVRANLPIVLFLLFCLLSVAWSDFPFVTFKRWVKAIGNVTMVLIVLTELDPATAVKRLFAWAGFLLIPLSVLLIRYYPELGRAYNRWTWTPTSIGVSTDKNGLGVVCLVFGLASLWNIIEALRDGAVTHRRARITAHGVVVAMALWLFSVAHSSTSFGCFLLGGTSITVMTLSRSSRPSSLHAIVGTMSVIGVLAVGLLDGGMFAIQALGRDSTLTGRTELWEALLRAPINSWFGTGFESFWLGDRARFFWDLYWWHPNQAHNGYLEMYLDLGLIGLGLLALLILSGYRNIVAAYGREPGLTRFKLALILIVPVYNVTEAAFKLMNPVWVAFLLVITAVPELLTSEHGRNSSVGPSVGPSVTQRGRRWGPESGHLNSGSKNRLPKVRALRHAGRQAS